MLLTQYIVKLHDLRFYNGSVLLAYHGRECLPCLCSSGINEESNYCRNIEGGERGPWCYVLDVN